MEINRKIVVFIAGLVLAGTLITIFFPKEDRRNSDAPLRIGAGADISGILMEETVRGMNGKYTVSQNIESTSFQDC